MECARAKILISALVYIRKYLFPFVNFSLVSSWPRGMHEGGFLPSAPSPTHLRPHWLADSVKPGRRGLEWGQGNLTWLGIFPPLGLVDALN